MRVPESRHETDFAVGTTTDHGPETAAQALLAEEYNAMPEHQNRPEELEKALDESRNSEARLRKIIDTIPTLAWCNLPDGSNEFLNQRWHDYTLRLSPSEGAWLGMAGNHPSRRCAAVDGHIRARVFHPEDIERLREVRRSALIGGAPFETEQRVRGKDGKVSVASSFVTTRSAMNKVKSSPLGTRREPTSTIANDPRSGRENEKRRRCAKRLYVPRCLRRLSVLRRSRAECWCKCAKVAPTDSTVLILGETGTGKELIARAIHNRSRRAARAFIRVNCAAIPPSLIASELFGHEKGSFTGALQRRLGRFELADGGTLFLDEVGELPLETQVALLRVLQEREFERVGGNQTVSLDVRVLAATNRELSAAITAGTFRQDLYYRLNVFPIRLPALRERVDDIPLLAEYLIDRYAQKAGKRIRTIGMTHLSTSRTYDWPGNIRELQNVTGTGGILLRSRNVYVWTKFCLAGGLSLKSAAAGCSALVANSLSGV